MWRKSSRPAKSCLKDKPQARKANNLILCRAKKAYQASFIYQFFLKYFCRNKLNTLLLSLDTIKICPAGFSGKPDQPMCDGYLFRVYLKKIILILNESI